VQSHLPPECKCAFCDKWKWQVKMLIAGQTAYICDECVELCVEIISGEHAVVTSQDQDP
jgi:ATP-dependent Clp protease ATP-binding subunit ClpX